MNIIPRLYSSESNSMHCPRRIERYIQLNVSSVVSSSIHQDKVALDDLNGALEIARDIDKKHGLCTEPSQKAWGVVDDIYQKIQAFRDDGKHASNNVPSKSPRQNTRRKVVFTSRTIPSEREIKGRRYFF